MAGYLDFFRAFLQMLVRNRQALFWTFFFPVLLMLLLGVVFGRGYDVASRLAIVQQDRGAVATALVGAFEQAGEVQVVMYDDVSAARRELEDDAVQGVLVLPEGLQQRFADGGTIALEFYYDNSNLIAAGQTIGVTQAIVENVGAGVAQVSLPLTIEPLGVKTAGFDYLDFLVPGIVALAIMQTGIFGMAGIMSTYKEKGILRRLKATPLPLRSFMAANVSVRVLTGIVQMALILLIGALLFGVTINGSLLVVTVVAVIGAGAFVSLGFAIAGIAADTESAQAIMQVVQMPMMFLSGIFFPMDNAPSWIQPVVKIMPLTYLADAMREIIVDGAGLWAVRIDIAVLLATTAVFLVVGVRFFRWE